MRYDTALLGFDKHLWTGSNDLEVIALDEKEIRKCRYMLNGCEEVGRAIFWLGTAWIISPLDMCKMRRTTCFP
jgi:hypothetical protein